MLYTDTDSIIFSCPKNIENPLKTGDKLGELVDEYPGKRITGYWSPGPKQYLLTFEDKITKEYSQILKIRGMTLNEEAENKISAEKFKTMVEKIGEEPGGNCEGG